MKVLITGSCGYIGAILSAQMIEQGHQVFGCDNNLEGKDVPGMLRRFRVSFEDDFVIRQILLYKIDVIVHLAATSTVGPDALDPLQYYDNNTAKTISFIHKLATVGWKGQLVFASTAAVYGKFDRPVNEKDTLSPSSVYGHSKLLCERVLNHASRYDIKTTVFRFFNVAGAYNDLGEEENDTHLLSKICHHAAHNQELTVYGDDYPTRDGTCIRDYVHVGDVCAAIIWALEQERGGAYNLGTERGLSVKEMIEQFEMHTGITVKWTVGPRRQGDTPYLVADPSLFNRMSGFTYKYTVRDIINSSWEYYKNGF